MNNSETKYQKYLARKRQKGHAKNGNSTWGHCSSLAKQMVQAVSGPVHECLVPTNLFEQGIGSVIFSRSLPGGRMAMSVFLLDVYCLGVKDAFFRIITRADYANCLKTLPMSGYFQKTDPASFRKLVEGAVSYAQQRGLQPHADYAVARQIFANVETTACPAHFDYGHEGKPFYISGPYDSASRVQAILDQLEQRLGTDNYHFLVTDPTTDAG